VATIVEAMPCHFAMTFGKNSAMRVSQTQPCYSTQKDAERDTIAKNKQKNTYSQWQGHNGKGMVAIRLQRETEP